QTGELERLKEFGITKKMIAEQSAKMGHAEIINAKGQITDMEKFNEALFALMRERYSGGMDLQSKTFRGMISNAKDAMGTIATTLSLPIFEKLKAGLRSVLPVFESFQEYITVSAKDAEKTLTDAFGDKQAKKIIGYFDMAKAAGKGFVDFLNELKPAAYDLWQVMKNIGPVIGVVLVAGFKTLGDIIPPIVTGFTKVANVLTSWEGFIPVVSGLITAFVTYKAIVFATAKAQAAYTLIMKAHRAAVIAVRTAYIVTAISGGGLRGVLIGLRAAFATLNVVMLANPIGAVIAVVAGLAAGFVILYKRSESFREMVNKVWDSLKNLGNKIKTEFKQDVSELDTFFSELGKTIKDGFLEDVSEVKTFFSDVGKSIETNVPKWKAPIDNFFNEAKITFSIGVNNLKSIMDKYFLDEQGKFPTNLAGWKNSFSNFFNDVKALMVPKLLEWKKTLDQWLKDQNEENKRQFGEWGTTIVNWFKSIPGKIGENIANWWNPIRDWFAELPGKSRTKLNEWWESIRTFVVTKYQNWKTSLSTWWKSISEWFSGLPGKTTTKLGEWWRSISNWIINTAKSWQTALSSWWQEIKSWFTSLKNKPEIKKSGRELVDKVKDGATEKKKTLMDNIGKIVVDSIGYMLLIAGVVALSAGRELIKRIISGMKAAASWLSEQWESFNTMAKKKLTKMASTAYEEAKKIPGKIGDGIKNKVSNATKAMKDLADSLVKKFKEALGINSPSAVFYDMAQWIIKGLINGLSASNLKNLGKNAFKDFAGGALSSLSDIKDWVKGGLNFAGIGAGGNVQGWIKQAMALTNTPASWFNGLVTIAQKESGGNPRAVNNWDINAKNGIPSMGLMQTIGPTFQSYKKPGFNDILNPVHNAMAAINYIKDRYGNIFNVPGIKSMMRGGKYMGYG
ncbi:MAG: transglycosylase SLT domain-containing protein, partial [Bacillus sp. (in: firmicutes)]